MTESQTRQDSPFGLECPHDLVEPAGGFAEDGARRNLDAVECDVSGVRRAPLDLVTAGSAGPARRSHCGQPHASQLGPQAARRPFCVLDGGDHRSDVLCGRCATEHLEVAILLFERVLHGRKSFPD